MRGYWCKMQLHIIFILAIYMRVCIIIKISKICILTKHKKKMIEFSFNKL